VVARQQLLAAGLSRHVIDELVKTGFLHPLHRGVFAVGHTALPEFGREQAALLACGAGAVISGPSALYLWDVLDSGPDDVDVTVAGRRCRTRPGVRVRHVEWLDRRQIRTRHGMDVVFPARALIEYAAAVTPDQLGDAIADARYKGRIREGELEAAAAAAGRRPGAPQVRAWLQAEAGPAITRSRAERRFRKLLQAAQLPQPLVNVRVGGWTPDFLWPEEKVVLEVDGWDSHRHRHAFERDRKKDRVLHDAGYHVIRVTWRHFTEETLALIAHIARMLDRRRVA
jgi:very-short-patch-repair endonuclease